MERFGCQKGAKINQESSKIDSGSEDGEISRIVLASTREHRFGGSEVLKKDEKSQNSWKKTYMQTERQFSAFFMIFRPKMEPKWSLKGAKMRDKVDKVAQKFEMHFSRQKRPASRGMPGYAGAGPAECARPV